MTLLDMYQIFFMGHMPSYIFRCQIIIEACKRIFAFRFYNNIKLFYNRFRSYITLAKRHFTIDIGKEQIPVEGQVHRNVAIKYLMKRRRSLLMTKNPDKIEKLWNDLPQTIKIIGKQLTREYRISWARTGTEEFQGSRFIFTIDDIGEFSTAIVEK